MSELGYADAFRSQLNKHIILCDNIICDIFDEDKSANNSRFYT